MTRFRFGTYVVDDVTVDYYWVVNASGGLQIGAQQYSHVLFFMTEEALSQFRRSPGWAVGADVRYATPDQGLMLGKETTARFLPFLLTLFFFILTLNLFGMIPFADIQELAFTIMGHEHAVASGEPVAVLNP